MTQDRKWSLSEDRTRLVVEVAGDPPSRIEYTVQQVESFIASLARIREAMLPGRPLRDPRPGEQFETARLGRWWVQPNPLTRGVALAILHPGYGWIALPLDRQSTDLLAEMIQRLQPAAEEPPPRSKLH